jgi:hypothetical protein
VGVIVTEEYVCDYCTKPIAESDVIVGKLSLRKRGARGLGREVGLMLHSACSDKLTATASGVAHTRRSRSAAQALAEPEELPAEPETPPARRRRAKSSM